MAATMKWLAVLVALVLVALAGLFLTESEAQRADFTFTSPSEHHHLDPQRVSWRHDFRIVELLFDPLVKFKLPEMVVEPAAAERWDLSADGCTYTFHLRRDARWSNGDPVTAHDFVYGFRRALLPDFGADYSQLLFAIVGAEEFFKFRSAQIASSEDPLALWAKAQDHFAKTVAITAPDDFTFVVTLKEPMDHFLELCALAVMFPVHRRSVEPQVSLDPVTRMLVQDPYWTSPGRLITNGPYVLAERRFKRDLLLRVSPTYWNRSIVGPKTIRELIITNPKLALLLYERGEADYLPEIPSASPLAADLAQQDRPDVHLIPSAGTYFYNFNCLPKRPDGSPNPLHDPRVRRALAMAVDKKLLVEKVTRLNQPVAQTFVPLGSLPGYTPPTHASPAFDPPAARDLLREAGASDMTGLSILYNTGMGHEQIAQAIARMWSEHLGVDVSLEGVESKAFGKRLRSQDYLIARAGWFGDYRDPTTYLDKFLTVNGNNDAKWSDPDFDALMAKAASERDRAARMAMYEQAEAMMLAQSPILPLYQYLELHLYDPGKLKDLHLNAWSFRRYELIRIDSIANP